MYARSTLPKSQRTSTRPDQVVAPESRPARLLPQRPGPAARTLRTAVFPPLALVAGGGGESSSPPALQSCNLSAISVPE
jgi:hypothetical protein